MEKCIVTTKEGTTFEADARKGKYYEFFGAKVVYNKTADIVPETVKETKTKQVKKPAENKVKPKTRKNEIR